MATNPVDPEPPEPNVNPLSVAPANKPTHKPDDRLTDDSPIAPPDHKESPHEQHIVDTDPHRALHPDEDDNAFNEFRTPGEDLDLHGTHAHRIHTGLTTGTPGTANYRTVPLWAIGGCALLIAVSFLYLGAYSGGFQGDVFNEEVNYHPISGPPVDPNSPEAMAAAGQKVFTVNCVQCHQVSGLGQAGQYPPLVASEWVVGDAPKRLTQILLHGIQGTIHVKGDTYNNQMPAWGGVLTDKQIAQVLTYVRNKLGGNSAGPITEKEMDDARKLTEAHSDAWTEAELKSIPPGPLDGGAAAPLPARLRPPARPRLPPTIRPTMPQARTSPPPPHSVRVRLPRRPPRHLDKNRLLPVIAMYLFAPRHSSWPGSRSAMTPTIFRSFSAACPPCCCWSARCCLPG